MPNAKIFMRCLYSDCTHSMPFFDKKRAKLSVFYVKIAKIRWRLGVSPPDLRLWAPPLPNPGWTTEQKEWTQPIPLTGKTCN